MDVRYEDGRVLVKLSERNLADLMAQVSEATTLGNDLPTSDGWAYVPNLNRMTPEGMLRVAVEPDEKHYESREPGRGSGLVG